MTNDELRAAIAVALGWEITEVNDKGDWHRITSQGGLTAWELLPDWPRSLDACVRDLLPVARERGWWPAYSYVETQVRNDNEQEGWGFMQQATGDESEAYAPTGEIALALCEAWLAGPAKAVA